MSRREIRIGSDISVVPPDWNEHSRTPGYVGDKTGAVSESYGVHTLPSSVVRGEPVTESLYSVQFEAEELFGTGDHRVHVDLYESALEVNRGR